MKNTSDNQIVATLKHGKVLERRLSIMFWGFLIFFIVAAVLLLVAIIMISVLVERIMRISLQ